MGDPGFYPVIVEELELYVNEIFDLYFQNRIYILFGINYSAFIKTPIHMIQYCATLAYETREREQSERQVLNIILYLV